MKKTVFNIFCLYFYCVATWAQHSPAPLKFQHLGVSDGLSNVWVSDIFQDSRGFLWVATQYGLNRYDGYDFHIYSYLPDDSTSLSANWVYDIEESADGRLWLGTNGNGLNVFDPRSEKFRSYLHRPADPDCISDNNVRKVLIDHSGQLWAGTEYGGLNQFFESGNYFSNYQHDPEVFSSISYNRVRTFVETLDDKFWVGTDKGLNFFDKKTGEFQRYYPNFPEGCGLSSRFISCLFISKNGDLWVGTDNGLNRFNPSTKTFQSYLPDPSNGNALQDGMVNTILEDSSGRFWVGTQTGLHLFHPDSGTFDHYRHDASNPNSIREGAVLCILEDRTGTLWFGTSSGLSMIHPQSGQFDLPQYGPAFAGIRNAREMVQDGNDIWVGTTNGLFHFDLLSGRLTKKLDAQVHSILLAKNGTLYVGTSNTMGFYQIEPKMWRVRHFSPDWSDTAAVHGETIWQMAEDLNGNIWLGAWRCLQKFDPRDNSFTHFRAKEGNPNGLLDDKIQALLFDQKGNLWVGTNQKGLALLSAEEQLAAVPKFRHFLHNPTDPKSLSSHSVLCLLEDRQGHIWVGTDGGLNHLDPNSENFKYYLRRDGLGDDKIMAMLEDVSGQIWASTISHGIVRLEPENGHLKNFYERDGLASNSFYMSSGWKNSDGSLLFGSTGGIVAFDPSKVKALNSQIPPIFLTELRLGDQLVEIGSGNGSLSKHVFFAQNITLEYWQDVLTLKFAALNFNNPEKNSYTYRLEGFDREWQQAGHRREVTYTNLDPGRYTFRVRGSNNDGVWNEEGAVLHIRVLPPWWRTGWFYGLVATSIAFGLFRLYRFQLKKQLAQEESRRLRELDELKTRLYANITHEFRTPLTLILGMAAQGKKRISQTSTPELISNLNSIELNGERLLQLINQLLDLGKLEGGKMKTNFVNGDVNAFLGYLCGVFASAASANDIHLRCETDGPCPMDFDKEKMQQIVSNLLSNALKFTPPGGEVLVNARSDGDEWLLQVHDTGSGIPMEDLPKIFDRFFQADNSTTRRSEGSGIGLALTRELVQLLNGNISAESPSGLPGGLGATFTLRLPLRSGQGIMERMPLLPPLTTESPAIEVAAFSKTSNAEAPLLLLIEDNAEVANYVASCLANSYRLEFAENGRIGIEKALEMIPDFIVSDVMMPEADGFEVCSKLKNDERTSHIPILLLTALAGQTAKMQGLRTGADVYLNKPFDEQELLLHVEKLLDLRRRLQDRYARGMPSEKSGKEIFEKEDAFLTKLRLEVEAHLGDPAFGVPQLCQQISMSRSHLHRKLAALTGHSATRFIRSVRLAKAKQLLRETDLNVSEVAFDTGFNDPLYFSRVFSEEEGISPTEWREGNENA